MKPLERLAWILALPFVHLLWMGLIMSSCFFAAIYSPIAAISWISGSDDPWKWSAKYADLIADHHPMFLWRDSMERRYGK